MLAKFFMKILAEHYPIHSFTNDQKSLVTGLRHLQCSEMSKCSVSYINYLIVYLWKSEETWPEHNSSYDISRCELFLFKCRPKQVTRVQYDELESTVLRKRLPVFPSGLFLHNFALWIRIFSSLFVRPVILCYYSILDSVCAIDNCCSWWR